MKTEHTNELVIPQITYICDTCKELMQFHSADEIETYGSILHFLIYICEKCDDSIWVLDRSNLFMKGLTKYIKNNVCEVNDSLIV